MKRTLREFQVALGMKYSENKNSHNNRKYGCGRHIRNGRRETEELKKKS